MTESQKNNFFQRIDRVTGHGQPLFGNMNLHQMICHCGDQIRLALGTKVALKYGEVDPEEIKALARAGKTVPTPVGFGQLEGEGTLPTSLENDKQLLKGLIEAYSNLPDDFKYFRHP